jgi:hypothetical protein
MSDDETVAEIMAENSGELDDRGARIVASWWHGGQTTALYSFASTGTITEDLDWEIGKCDTGNLAASDLFTLAALARYVETRGERGPREGWSELHW